MAGKKDSYLAITGICMLTLVIGILVYYLLRLHVPPEIAQPEDPDEDPRKAARRAQRDAARRQREEALREQEEKKAVLAEKQSKREEERLKREQAELEKKLVDYNKWKARMRVVSTEPKIGKHLVSDDEIISFVEQRRKANIDDLSLHFDIPMLKMRDRLLALSDSFPGLIDDLGTCIYFSEEELSAIRALQLPKDSTRREFVTAINKLFNSDLLPS